MRQISGESWIGNALLNHFIKSPLLDTVTILLLNQRNFVIFLIFFKNIKSRGFKSHWGDGQNLKELSKACLKPLHFKTLKVFVPFLMRASVCEEWDKNP